MMTALCNLEVVAIRKREELAVVHAIVVAMKNGRTLRLFERLRKCLRCAKLLILNRR